ncbi:MAG TPA: biotin/lipoyl-containing protein [Ktedonobacteraceae bacterium]|nr:biotin/lipoyl-containing protein [Ktedonobacteraceae bacterium]
MTMDKENKSAWLARVEELINVLEGSSIGELELTEGETEIIIKRKPNMVLTALPTQVGTVMQGGANSGTLSANAARVDKNIAATSPLTGVYYASPAPTSPSFVNVGDVIHVGQVIALVEAMKVFNEVTAEVSGRVVAIVAVSGEVVQKGDALLKVEPL